MLRKKSFWENVTASMVATAAALAIALVAAYASAQWQRSNQKSEALLQEANKVAEQTTALSYDALDLTTLYVTTSKVANREQLNSFFNDNYVPRLKAIRRQM